MADDTPKIKNASLSQGESTSKPLFADPFIGFVLEERYRITELIGTGGWGKVYRARHVTLDMDLAVKIVHEHHLKDKQGLKRFEQEAQLLSRVENQHIVRIIDHGLSPAPFIVMEYVPGTPLSDWLKDNGSMPPQMAIDLFLQLCDALSAAEAIRIVHRDLKPSNILLKTSADGIQCKVLDFGLAKFVEMNDMAERLTATGEILGSPAYMPPEQWKGQCDHRSDIYSLGCIMYEVLTGKPPFSAQFGLEYMSKHVSDLPPAISQSNSLSRIPVGLEDIVNKCMQKSPANRYQSSLACRDDLLRLKAGSRPAINLLERLGDVTRRRLIGVCSALLIVLCGAFFLAQQMRTIGEYEDTGRRGEYFAKASYAGAPIPRFENCRDKLPKPIIEDSPQYLELYWTAWRLAFQNLKRPPAGSPLVSNFIDPAFGPAIFQWDTAFMMPFGRYAHHVFPFIESLDNFYCRQYHSGYICQEILQADGADAIKNHENTVNPPLFAWAELEYARISGDRSRFAKVIPVLRKHAEWLDLYRRKPGAAHKLFWNTPDGSGMENTPRSGSGWVDMSAQMVLMYKCLAEIEGYQNEKESAAKHRKQAADIAALINQWMWNDADGLYYDLDDRGNQIRVKTIACFWPMLAGICNEHQVTRLMANLKDPKLFWRHNVFPSLAADHPDYKEDGSCYLGGVWAPTNDMIIKGLDNYPAVEGEKELAVEAVRRYLDSMYAVYKSTGTIWQNYSAESDARAKWAKPDFVGWSGLGPIQLLIEDILGIQADGLEKRINWRLTRTDRHGIENMQFGDITASLVAARRESAKSPAEITVTTDKPFELRVLGRKTAVFQVPAGKHSYHVD